MSDRHDKERIRSMRKLLLVMPMLLAIYGYATAEPYGLWIGLAMGILIDAIMVGVWYLVDYIIDKILDK